MYIFLHLSFEPCYLGLEETYMEFSSLIDLSSMYLVLYLLDLLRDAHR